MEMRLLKHLATLEPGDKENLYLYFKNTYSRTYIEDSMAIKQMIDSLVKENLIRLWDNENYTDIGKIMPDNSVYDWDRFHSDDKVCKAVITFAGKNYLFNHEFNDNQYELNNQLKLTNIIQSVIAGSVMLATIAQAIIAYLLFKKPC